MSDEKQLRPPLVIDRFITGLVTRRSQLMTPFRALGINIVQFHDVLIDGLNVEVSDNYTLQRRPGFSRYCAQALGPSEIANQYYSVRNLSGTVTPLVDTNLALSSFSTSTITNIFTKSTTKQGFIQQVGNTTYYANGTDFIAWNGTSTRPVGIAAPNTVPTVTPTTAAGSATRFWAPGVTPTPTSSQPGWAILDYNGNIQLTTPTGQSTGTSVPNWSFVNHGTTVDGGIGNWGNFESPGSWVPSIQYGSLFGLGAIVDSNGNLQLVNIGGTSGTTQPTWNTSYGGLTTDGTSTPQLQWLNAGPCSFLAYAGYQYVYCYRTIFGHLSTASPNSITTGPIIGSTFSIPVSGVGTSSSLANSTATITNIGVSGNTLTVTCSNSFVPGLTVGFSGITTASFLNGKNVVILSATSSQFTAFFNHANYGPASDGGTVTFKAVEIYRTSDGGGIYEYLDAVTNPGGGSTWTYTDVLPDASLNQFQTAPIAHLNDPPPGQPGSLVSTGGTILAYWQGRLWMAVGNKVYFSAGPDCLNGIPEESWPPANVFTVPGNVTAITPTSQGMLIWTVDTVTAILGGPATASFYPYPVMQNFGVASPNCITQDGDQIYLLTTGGQYFSLNLNGKNEDGQRVGDLLAANFPSTSSYVALHRNGQDTGVFLSNGTNDILRFSLNVQCWSPMYQPVNGCGPLNSIELTPGVYGLMMSAPTGGGHILRRDVNTFADDGNAYAAFVTIGSITLSEPGQPLIPLWHVLGYFANVGTLPGISVLFNEISATNGASFINLPNALNEPPIGADPSVTLISKRWPVNMNQAKKSQLVHHAQVKVTFSSTDTVKNECLAIGLKFDNI